jgi:7-cyano-7-deazaguanine synthase
MTPILICFSGGLDSVTLAAKLKKAKREIAGLFVDRGQSNLERERESIVYFAKRLDMPLFTTSLRDWRDSWRELDGVQVKEVPRNAMFVLAALPFARKRHAGQIALGSNRDDTAMPDGSPTFVKALNQLLEAAKQPELVVAPFLDAAMGKSDVAALALELLGEDGVAKTWSCWAGNLRPCGECLACRNRETALNEARARQRRSSTSA